MEPPLRNKYHRGILCKLKFETVVKLAIILLISLRNEKVNASENDKESRIYNGNFPMSATQRISILIGDGGENANSGNIGILNDNGDNNSNSSSGGIIADSTTWDKCNRGSSTKCCYQYTWPGYRSNIPAPSNATCEYLRKEKRDESFACFDPLVFTKASGDEALWTPPDFDQLREESRTNNWNIYCPMAEKNCITYTYYSRGGSKAIANETKFCGIVTDSSTGQLLEDGCYRQNVAGFIREVCVCKTSLCNSEGNMKSPRCLLIVFISTVFAVYYLVPLHQKFYK